jgi:hypothetical protein
MNTLALRPRGLLARHTPLSHRSSFSPRSALAFPQPPPLAAAPAAALCAALGTAFTAVLRRVLQPPRMELRIDVNQPDDSIEAELDILHGRLHRPGDALHTCTRLPACCPAWSSTTARPTASTTSMWKTSRTGASPATRCSTA